MEDVYTILTQPVSKILKDGYALLSESKDFDLKHKNKDVEGLIVEYDVSDESDEFYGGNSLLKLKVYRSRNIECASEDIRPHHVVNNLEHIGMLGTGIYQKPTIRRNYDI